MNNNVPWVGLFVPALLRSHYPIDRLLECYAPDMPKPAIATLWGEGDGYKAVRMFHEKFCERPHMLLLHLTNEEARHNGCMHEGDFLRFIDCNTYNSHLEKRHDDTVIKLRRRLKLIQDWIDAAFNIPLYVDVNDVMPTIYLSTGYHSRLSRRAHYILLEYMRRSWTHPIRPLLVSAPAPGTRPPWHASFQWFSGTEEPDYGRVRPCNQLVCCAPTSINFGNVDTYPDTMTPEQAQEWALKHSNRHAVFYFSAAMNGLDARGWNVKGANQGYEQVTINEAALRMDGITLMKIHYAGYARARERRSMNRERCLTYKIRRKKPGAALDERE